VGGFGPLSFFSFFFFEGLRDKRSETGMQQHVAHKGMPGMLLLQSGSSPPGLDSSSGGPPIPHSSPKSISPLPRSPPLDFRVLKNQHSNLTKADFLVDVTSRDYKQNNHWTGVKQPIWKSDPALGGFNPLRPRQALRHSVCAKFAKKDDKAQHLTDVLVRQAEKMIENESSFYRRGSIAGWKIKPVTTVKTWFAVSRVGGVDKKRFVHHLSNFSCERTSTSQVTCIEKAPTHFFLSTPSFPCPSHSPF
jgi:hypothetical protein